MKKLMKFVSCLFSLSFAICNLKSWNNEQQNDTKKEGEFSSIVVDDSAFSSNIQSNMLKNQFNSYEMEQSEKELKISAKNTIPVNKAESFNNMSFILGETVITDYNLNYNFATDLISVNLSYFSDSDLMKSESFEGYPVYFGDGSIDAIFNINDKKIYLSELEKNNVENCFALTSVALGSLFAALASALIAAAKAAIIISAVIAVGYVTYQVASLTSEKIRERERSAIRESTYSNPYVYYPATRKDGQLLIASSPVGLCYAASHIVSNVDFWTPFGYDAKKLAIRASGGYVGPERDKNKNGYYQHYHLLHRRGGHSFFGYPYNDIYVI